MTFLKAFLENLWRKKISSMCILVNLVSPIKVNDYDDAYTFQNTIGGPSVVNLLHKAKKDGHSMYSMGIGEL